MKLVSKFFNIYRYNIIFFISLLMSGCRGYPGIELRRSVSANERSSKPIIIGYPILLVFLRET